MKSWIQSLRFFLWMSLITGLAYPFAMTGLSKLIFPEQSAGSFLKNAKGEIVGSELIAQDFKSDQYFRPRPSAVDYNPASSGASNLGPTSEDLLKKVEDRKVAGAVGGLLFSSGSGLDPHITPEDAQAQIARVAKSRNVNETKIYDIVQQNIEGRQLGFLGEKRVNVLKLNLALDSTLQ